MQKIKKCYALMDKETTQVFFMHEVYNTDSVKESFNLLLKLKEMGAKQVIINNLAFKVDLPVEDNYELSCILTSSNEKVLPDSIMVLNIGLIAKIKGETNSFYDFLRFVGKNKVSYPSFNLKEWSELYEKQKIGD